MMVERLSVSATTRAPRPGESDGVDYRFLTDAEFDRLVADGAFVEHAIIGATGRPQSRVCIVEIDQLAAIGEEGRHATNARVDGRGEGCLGRERRVHGVSL